VFTGVERIANRTPRRKAFTVGRRTTPTMENPYADVDWETVERLHSVNHTHTHPATPGEPKWDRETSTIADEGHSEYDNEMVSQDVGNGCVAGGIDSEHLMIKRDHLKYCYYGGDGEVLFDLATDPEESRTSSTNRSTRTLSRRFERDGPNSATDRTQSPSTGTQAIGNLNGSAIRNLGVLLAD